MGCQSTACKSCKNKYKACQLIQGLCPTCYSQKDKKETPNVIPTPPSQ